MSARKPEPPKPLGRPEYLENEPVRSEGSPAEIVNRELPTKRQDIAAKMDFKTIGFTEQQGMLREGIPSAERTATIAVGLQNSSPIVTARPGDNASVAPRDTERSKPGKRDAATETNRAVAPPLSYAHTESTDHPTPPLRPQGEREDNPGDYVEEPRRPTALVFSAAPVTQSIAQPLQQSAELRQSVGMTAAIPRLPAAQRATQEPQIQVSIGRIEIRATPSAQRSQRTSEAAQPSLNDYLQKRSRRSHG